MDDSEENMDCGSAEDTVTSPTGKTKSEISPLGVSRYDDAIDDNTDADFVKPPKTLNKVIVKTKVINATAINGVTPLTKENLIKPKPRAVHNNNMEIVHITGDSEVFDSKPSENVQKLQRIPKSENVKVPVLKPILSEEIFQTPSINVAEVFKIISNKPNDFELETSAKNNTKSILKTYTNKRKSFQRQSSLIESFGLPDEPIVPVNEDEYIKPLRISEIDVDMVKPEAVNLIDRELIDSLWKISSTEEDYICHDDTDVTSIPIFDIEHIETPVITKEFPISPVSNQKKGICALVYERGKDILAETKSKSDSKPSEVGDFEAHIKAALIDKSKKQEILENHNAMSFTSGIDINKLKSQITSRMELIKSEEKLKDERKNEDVQEQVEMESEIPVGVTEKEPSVPREVEKPKEIDKPIVEATSSKKGVDLAYVHGGDARKISTLEDNASLVNWIQRNAFGTAVKATYETHFPGFISTARQRIRDFGLKNYSASKKFANLYNKNEHIVPNKASKSYKQWAIGVQEADELKDKSKKEKLQFFKEMLLNKRQNKKPLKENLLKSERIITRPKRRGRRMKRQQENEPVTATTENMKNEILENLIATLESSNFKRTTRSSLHRRNSSKSHTTTESKDDIDDIENDNESGKQSTPSRFSDDESSNKSHLPLTLESQIALYKRNNLFKGVIRERICQICEKPDEVIKCRGRCNGYYHISCANKREYANENLDNSLNDISMDMTESQLDSSMELSQIEDEDLDDSTVDRNTLPNTTEAVLLNDTTLIDMVDTENNLDEKLKEDPSIRSEDKKNALRSRRSKGCVDLNAIKEKLDVLLEKDILEEEPKRDTQRRSRKSRFRDLSPSTRRITRSQSQEREIIPKEMVAKRPRRARSQRNSVSEDLGEIDILSMLKSNVKKEMHEDQIEISLSNITITKDAKENSINLETPRKSKKVLNQNLTHENSKNTENGGYKKPETAHNCNVKIVHIKDRRKTGNSPKLTLKQDPDFEKLPLNDQIDHTMKEVMQKFDKKPLYADSTTDYTSSEDSAIDLLSPKGKKILADCLTQDTSPNKVVSDDDANNTNTDDKKKINLKMIKPKHDESQTEIDFKCINCLEDIDYPCFVCHREISKKGSSIRQKCSLFSCGKFYHPECLKVWPQTQWSVISTTKHKLSNTNLDTFVCPNHVCHTCVSDDPRAAIPRCTSDKVVRCLRCPATYHNSAHCIPAGTLILSTTQIVCPRHLIPKRIVKKSLPIINTTWCFICSEGGDLICCEMCPTSVHSECLKINLTEDDTFICEDCETGRFPLYDEIVWVKFSRGRVFLFQEGDSGEMSYSSQKRTYAEFKKSIQEATEAHRLKKEFKQAIIDEAAIKSKHKPPHFIKIKVNRPVGNVRQFDGNISNTTPCECDPKSKNPCGADSDCLNRLLLTECNAEVCPAGEKCQNQNFEKRNYPPLVPYRTEGRGWGLKSLEKLKKGQFVIEYVGEMIDEQEYQRRIKKMHEQKEENYYFLTIDKDRMLDAGPKGNVARFMNHSCQPNCETQKWTVNGDTRVGLFAVVDIPANTELTFNYNLECVGKEKKICKCGAPNCSGFIGVKAKQEESRKRSKSKLKNKRKKNSPAPEPVSNKPCFVCGETGEVSVCNNKICTKSYHLRCVNLETLPDSKWVCPWHSCTICTKRTIRCCVKCIKSYCPVHSDGNIRYDKLLGFVCAEHDPNKANTPQIKLENIPQKDDSSPPKLTDESDVTSTTSNEEDSKRQESQPERQTTPQELMDNTEIVTSTPIKLNNDTHEVMEVEHQTAEPPPQLEGVLPLKRKRGRPPKRSNNRFGNPKRKKLNDSETTSEIKKEDKGVEEHLLQEKEVIPINSRSTRNLRTFKSVNYRGVKQTVQKKRDSVLPIRKRSRIRSETML
ncbi:set domain protein [Holotrichia oblita]|uniref:Set domain protein n=1 Tax=Holotrichia oblita TaxID=644536 RepID=A0ACB9T565_HOLOL|nr:set domain protein [Holotrichia oblita]